MANNKGMSVAVAALELTKMVLMIAANTTCKLVSVGKSEIAKQYTEYRQKATPQQLAAIKMFKEMASRGTRMAKSELQAAKTKVLETKTKVQETKTNTKPPSSDKQKK